MVWSVAVSSDGRYVLSGGNDAVPILWDARTGREIHRLRGHTEQSRVRGFLTRWPARGLFGRGRHDPSLGCRERPGGLSSFHGPTGRNGWLAVSPDGHRLFSAGWRGTRTAVLESRHWQVDSEAQWEAPPTRGIFHARRASCDLGRLGRSPANVWLGGYCGPAERSTTAIDEYKEAIRRKPEDANPQQPQQGCSEFGKAGT